MAYSVGLSRLPSMRTYINISETGGPIAIRFYLKHHLGGEKVAFGFGVDQIRSLFTMTTDTCSSHRVIIWENGVSVLFQVF